MKFEKYTLQSGKIKWKFYHYLGINPDTGKKDVIERQGFNSKAEARASLLKLITEYEEGQQIKRSEKDKYRFSEVFDLWLVFYKKQVKITSYTKLKNSFKNHVLPLFGDYYISKIDVRTCQEAVEQWFSTYAEASLLVNYCNQIFNFGINQGFCRENPMLKTIRPRNTHRKDYTPLFYEKDELIKFLNITKENEPTKTYIMFHVLAYTGIRHGELRGLKWTDIDFKKKTLSVNRNVIYNNEVGKYQASTPKSKSSIREIGIDDLTIRYLFNWKNEQRKDFLRRGININSDEQIIFPNRNNGFIDHSFLNRTLKKTIENHNLSPMNVHGFRHTRCSLLFEAGVDMNNVRERLGHGSIKTTMNIYAHVTETERNKTADVFSEFMNVINL